MKQIVKKIRSQIIKEFRSLPGKSWVVDSHLLVVEKWARKLYDLYPRADKEVVLLGVWLHDIAHARKKGPGHDLYGAKEARKILKKYHLPKEKIQLVYEVCRAHCCQEVKPKSLEAKILATADAISHLVDGFYLRLFFERRAGNDFEKTKQWIQKKLERDFHDKIILPKAKIMVRPLYGAWKKILAG